MTPRSRNLLLLPLVALMALGVAACETGNTRRPPAPVAYQPPVPQQPIVPQFSGPILNQDGSCSAAAPTTATAIVLGMGECELVRLKGRTPTDILIGESGRGGRETQVLYAEPTGRELYFFTNNKLDRIRTPDRTEGGV